MREYFDKENPFYTLIVSSGLILSNFLTQNPYAPLLPPTHITSFLSSFYRSREGISVENYVFFDPQSEGVFQENYMSLFDRPSEGVS
jgi:hypothetical protein